MKIEIINRQLKVFYRKWGVTFGIYLIEPIVRPLTECVADALIPYIGNILGTLVWVGVVFAISGCVTYVLK